MKPHRGGSEDHTEVEETHTEVVEKDHYGGGREVELLFITKLEAMLVHLQYI